MRNAFSIHEESGVFHLQGALDIYHAKAAQSALEKTLRTPNAPNTKLDAATLTKLDTAGAMLLLQLQQKHNIKLQHLKPEHKALFALVAKTEITSTPVPKKPLALTRLVSLVGQHSVAGYQWLKDFTAFFGHACISFTRAVRSPRRFRFSEIMHFIETEGIYAVPIISAMAFMIAIVLCYQGVAQLRPLGAQNLSVNLVAISVLREMGVLLTAIMVAGRSGSAFAAEIGVMKVREEVDALQVSGMDPFEVLVMPRLLALVVALTLLTFIADLMGLLGGGIMSKLLIGIPLGAYVDRVQQVARWHDFYVGIIKAPVFAFLIAMVGCMHGMKVAGSAESVGHETTAAVVKSIFLVLVADAFFSVLFEKLGI